MISYIKRGLLAVGAVLAVAGAGAPAVAGAQTAGANGGANGFRVSPVRSELTIEKGKSSKITLTVENPTDLPTAAKVVVNDFVASDDETGTPRLILDDNASAPKNSFKSLVNNVDDIALTSKGKKDVEVTISVPQNASAGGYYGAVRFVPASNTKDGNVGLTASVGTIILVTVPGTLSEKLDLVQMTAAQNGKPKSFFTSGDVSVITRLKNDGDIHLQPFGRVEIKNMFGKVVASYEFNNTDPRGNILPASVRKFDDSLPKKNWFGRYTISANLGYSQGSGNILSVRSTFWYMPTWSLYALLALVVAIAVAVFLLVRRFSGRAQHRGKK